jgi:enamine deaminase RidA (YjgF/YER057c/UK114 family)
MKKMLLPDSEMDVQAVAIVDGSFERISNPSLYVPASSGFSPGFRVGDYVLPSGAMASPPSGQPDRNGLAMEATSPPWTRWSGRQIELETRYIVATKMKDTFERAGASLRNVVKGQAYISHIEDAAVFHAAWQAIFKDSPVPVTVVPMPDPGFGNTHARTEINVIGLVDGGDTKKEIVDAGVFTGYEGQPNAVKSGDLLLLNGLMAAERTGLAPEARVDKYQPWFGSSVKGQARNILSKAQKICAAAGTSLENVVRIQQFHTDISEFYAVMEVWREFLPGRPLPFSAVQCGPAMPVPGATLLMDLWVYAP